MKFVWGLMLGFGLGIAAGLILAPQSGEATRAQLGEQGIMLRGRSGYLPDDLRNRAAGFSDELRARANYAVAQGREVYARTRDELSGRYGRAKSGNM